MTELSSNDATNFAIEGRVAIVTGGGQGIGREYTKALAAKGAISIIAEMKLENARKVVAEITAKGGNARAIQCDVADVASVNAMVGQVTSEFGRIDILINNAAIFSSLTMKPFDQIPLDEWDRVMAVNVNGTFYCSRAVLPSMKKAGWGRIVNVSSSSVALGLKNYLHYVASKAAVEGMTSSMARELGEFAITVNALVPGGTETEIPRVTLTPELKAKLIAAQCVQRLQTPADLLGPMLFLVSPAASFVTGQCIAVNGGLTHR